MRRFSRFSFFAAGIGSVAFSWRQGGVHHFLGRLEHLLLRAHEAVGHHADVEPVVGDWVRHHEHQAVGQHDGAALTYNVPGIIKNIYTINYYCFFFNYDFFSFFFPFFFENSTTRSTR